MDKEPPSSPRDHTSIAPLLVSSWSPTIDLYALTAAVPSDNAEIDSALVIACVFELFLT